MQSRDSWGTPWSVYNYCNQIYRFDADICADHINHKHPVYFTKWDDSLNFNWHDKLRDLGYTDKQLWVWCNPPYSDPYPWCDAAIKSGVGVILLLKYDVSTSWWRLLNQSGTKMMPITGKRLQHIPPKGIATSSNNFCSLLVEVNPYFQTIKQWQPVDHSEIERCQ